MNVYALWSVRDHEDASLYEPRYSNDNLMIGHESKTSQADFIL